MTTTNQEVDMTFYKEQPTILHDTPCIDYVSTIDGGYIGLKGVSENWLEILAKHGIAPQLASPDRKVCSIGFSEKEQKWYGWSHRAMYGFTIGDSVKRGDCAYRPADEEGFRQKYLNFFGVGEHHKNPTVVDHTDENGKRGALITATYTDDVPNKKLRGTEYRIFWPYENEKFGRGEWTAETMDDAKQMAIDFAEGV